MWIEEYTECILNQAKQVTQQQNLSTYYHFILATKQS